MTEDEIIRFANSLPGVEVMTADQASGAPEVAWGDSFVFYDPDPEEPPDRRFPFTTIVTKDYAGFDEASNLNRDGVFRLNISVGRDTFRALLGYPPAQFAEHQADYDYTVLDTVLPHPTYGHQAWVSILNPGERTSAQAKALIAEALDRVARRHRARR